VTPGISDEVWRRLDPSAGALSRRTVIRMWAAAAAAVLLVIVGMQIWRTGIVVPRLVWPEGLTQFEENPDWVRVQIVVSNAGQFPVTVRDVGRSGPGLELLGVEGWERSPSPFPTTLQPGEGVGATLVYRITDCDGAPAGDWPVTALVDRPWGTMTVEVSYEAEAIHPWQDYVVSTWCRPGGPGPGG